MDSASWQTFFTVFATCFIAFLQYRTKKTVDKVHSLVNSAMTEQLRLTAVLAYKIVGLDPTQHNKELADEAERIYQASKSTYLRTEQVGKESSGKESSG